MTEPATTFTRTFRGYDPGAVDAHIEMLATKQQLLRDDVESLRARLRESGEEAAALRKEIAVLTETSTSPHAVQQRMAKMLRRAVDEASEMQAEARAEAEALVAAAEAEAAAAQRRRDEVLADMAEQQKAMEAEYAAPSRSWRPNWPACAPTPRRRASSSSATRSYRPITIATRPGARCRRPVSTGSGSSNS